MTSAAAAVAAAEAAVELAEAAIDPEAEATEKVVVMAHAANMNGSIFTVICGLVLVNDPGFYRVECLHCASGICNNYSGCPVFKLR